MGRAIPVTLGRFTFPSKKAAKDALRDLRDLHIDGAPIVDDDAVDMLFDVVRTHPQAQQKIGPGITGFYVSEAPEYGPMCFYLRRVDDTVTDFSWNEAITPASPTARLRNACRNAIAAEKMAYRDEAWPLADVKLRACPVTGKDYLRDDAHVDHIPPDTLKCLVDRWLAASNIGVDDVAVDHVGDLRAVDEIADAHLLESWRAYHAEHARLRLISGEGNLRQGARELFL